MGRQIPASVAGFFPEKESTSDTATEKKIILWFADGFDAVR